MVRVLQPLKSVVATIRQQNMMVRTIATQEVHAGDDSVYLLFTYTPSETITDGELRFTVPTNWSIPQEDDQGEHGYTYFEEVRNADIGAADIYRGVSYCYRRDY